MRILATVAIIAIIGNACAAAAETPTQQVVFVCEHGAVKSQMAASYFNQLAAQRGLPWRAVSRGSAPGSTPTPKPVADALIADGVDGSESRPQKIDAADVAGAARIVAIGADLPADVPADEQRVERWDDVPPASASYDAARSSLKAHVAELLDRLSRQSD
jgi:arsenate reductase (thioredoxin)